MKLPLSDGWVDLDLGRVERAGQTFYLTKRDIQLLRRLMEQVEPVSRGDLLQEIWGLAPTSKSRAVDLAASSLRSKLEVDRKQPVHVVTVYGVAGGVLVLPLHQVFVWGCSK